MVDTPIWQQFACFRQFLIWPLRSTPGTLFTATGKLIPATALETEVSVILVIGFQVRPDKHQTFMEILAGAQKQLPGTGGCRDIRILTHIDEPGAISLVETWSSQAEHQAHFAAIVASGDWERIRSHLSSDPVSGYYTETV
jgi:quinol monooxygenase YgiN